MATGVLALAPKLQSCSPTFHVNKGAKTMKMFKFEFFPDLTNLHPWDTDAAMLLNIDTETSVYATDPDSPDRKQIIWVSESIKNRYQKYLERFELIEEETTHQHLLERGAKSRL